MNEDRAATRSVGRDSLVAVVADGMGGSKAGAVASEAAVRGFLDVVTTCEPGAERRALDDAFASADRALHSAARPGREGMGTTLVAAIARGEDVWVGNIGDSRAVVVLPDDVIRLSEEHSIVGEALRAGQISEVEALHHPYRHAVSRAMGDGDARPDLRFHSLREHGRDAPAAVVVLGTDGLFNFIGDADLLEVVATAPDVRAVVHELVLRAIQNGSDDNVTAAALVLRRKPEPRRVRAAGLFAVLAILVAAIAIGTGTAGRPGVRQVMKQARLLTRIESSGRPSPGTVRLSLSPVSAPIAVGTSGRLCSPPARCFADWKIVEVTSGSLVVELAAAKSPAAPPPSGGAALSGRKGARKRPPS